MKNPCLSFYIALAALALPGLGPLRAEVVFEARFESAGSLAADVGNLFLSNGAFFQVPTSGSHPQLSFQTGAALFDAAGSGNTVGYQAHLGLTDTLRLDGASISVDFVHLRSVGSNTKSHYVTGYDSAGRTVFQIKLVDIENDLFNATTEQRQVPAYLDAVNGESVFLPGQIATGSAPDSNPLGDNNHTFFFGRDGSTASVDQGQAGRFKISTSDTGWTLVAIPRSGGSTLAAFTTIELPFVDPAASDLAKVVISGETGVAGGFWDNLTVEGDSFRSSLTTSASAPVSDLVLSQSFANSFTTIFDPQATDGDRGQSVLMPDSPGASVGWEIEAITVVTAQAKDFSLLPDTRLKIHVFEMPNVDDANDIGSWNGTDGLGDGVVFDGTGVTTFLLGGSEVPLNLNLANGTHLRLAFDPPLLMEENKAYGFLLSLDDGDGVAASSLRLQIARDNVVPNGETDPNGKMLGLGSAGATGTQATDDLAYYFQGAAAPAPKLFSPETADGPAMQRWGWDLKGSVGLTNTTSEAQLHFGDVPANLIRIPFYCDSHFSNGNVEVADYATMLDSLSQLLAVNPAVEIFASLKLAGGDSFLGPASEPGWITAGTASWPSSTGSIFGNTAPRPNPEFYSQLVADYYEYMDDNGITIDYLGLNNETDGALGVSRYIATVDLLKAELISRGFDISGLKFVAPDAFDPQNSVNIVSSVAGQSRLDTIDVVGSHMYPDNTGDTRGKWTAMSSAGGGKDLWHTELHLNPANANNGDPDSLNITRMRRGLGIVFASNIGGVDSMLWWQGGNSLTEIDDTLKRRVIQTTLGAHPVLSPAFNEQDSDVNSPFYQAYRKDQRLVFWLANPGSEEVNFPVLLTEGFVDDSAPVVANHWSGPGNTITAVNTGGLNIRLRADRRGFLISRLPANSISVIELAYSSPSTFAFTYPGLLADDDDNFNGLSNYLDYAAGFDPTTPGLVASFPTISLGAATRYQHTLRDGAEDVFVGYEYSTTLGGWDPLVQGVDFTLGTVGDGPDRVLHTLDLLPAFLSGKTKLFLRHRFQSIAP